MRLTFLYSSAKTSSQVSWVVWLLFFLLVMTSFALYRLWVILPFHVLFSRSFRYLQQDSSRKHLPHVFQCLRQFWFAFPSGKENLETDPKLCYFIQVKTAWSYTSVGHSIRERNPVRMSYPVTSPLAEEDLRADGGCFDLNFAGDPAFVHELASNIITM